MTDSLLSSGGKSEIIKAVKKKDFAGIIGILEKHKTGHAGTAKMKDKRFALNEIVKYITQNSEFPEKEFFETGKFFCERKEDNSKEIGVSIIWKGYGYDKKNAERILVKIADDKNWEVREYAGGAFANVMFYHNDFFGKAVKLAKHKSENVRRAVLFSVLGLVNKNETGKSFKIIELLMHDSSVYVKRNLGPFILGSYILRKHTDETMSMLKKWSKSDNVNIKWNVIMSFKNAFGNQNPGLAFMILSEFKNEKDKALQRALKSVLGFLSKKHEKEVNRFIINTGLNF